MWADLALRKLLEDYEFNTVLDVGSGAGTQAALFRAAGKKVTETDWKYFGDYLDQEFEEPFDLVWVSHVLEHQRNVGLFIEKLSRDCKVGGILAITVPPAKHNIVGGHVTIWNAGLLTYNIALAGIDCSDIRLKKYGYNISAIVRNFRVALPRLANDHGDLDTLKNVLPPWLSENSDGDIDSWNWDDG